MKKSLTVAIPLLAIVIFVACQTSSSNSPTANHTAENQLSELSRMRPDMQTRWASFENPLGLKGAGAAENRGAKGHPFDSLRAGETKTLLQAKGSGEIRRMWFTINVKDPEILRSLLLRIYWDGESSPAVEVPFGDFFLALLGRPVAFENALFANPEGRSFVSYVPMPFRKDARVTITNESGRNIPYLFYDIDFVQAKEWNPASLYFHANWRRENPTHLGNDFEILPRIEGEGRFIGAHVSIKTNPQNSGWWGEGVVKVYLDGDTSLPTLVGTGSEDYIGTAWGEGTFIGRYQGAILADEKKGEFGFYRYHLPDPIYFHRDIRVAMSQLGGQDRSKVIEMSRKGVPVKPVAMDDGGKWIKMQDSPDRKIDEYATASPDPGTIYFRQDDVSALALYYLDSPKSPLPPIAPLAKRVEGMGNTK